MFSNEELLAIKARFDLVSDKGYMTKQQFRDSLGILGLEPYLSERIFNHICDNGRLLFDDWLRYLNMLLNGSPTDKALWSFRLLSNNKQMLEIEDMERMIFEVCYLWNSMTGSKSMPKKELVEEIFGIFDNDRDGIVSFDEFKVVYQEGVELIGWFEFLNNEDVSINKIKEEWELHGKRKRKRITLINRPSVELNHQELVNQQLKFLQQELIQCSEMIRQEKEKSTQRRDLFYDSCQVLPKTHGPIFNDGQAQQVYGDDDPDQQFILNQSDFVFHTVVGDRFQHQMMNKLRFILQLTEQIKKLNGQGIQKQPAMEQSSVIKKSKLPPSSPISLNQTLVEGPESASGGKTISIYFGHENWNLVLNMMIGIRKAIKSLHPLSDDILLTSAHYEVKHQFEIVPKRTQDFDYRKSCHFYEYSPMIFERIRKMYGVSNEDFLRSMGPEQLVGDLIFGNLSSLTEKVSSGKSGSFFYYSSDDKYMLKTIQKDEFCFFRRIIKGYFQHLSENFNTLIIKIFGVYKIKQFRSKTKALKLYFVVMANILNPTYDINVKYDLKGSLYQRTSRVKGKPVDESIPLKDLDWLEDKQTLELPQKVAELFKMQISRDLIFFDQNRIIDYSLLVGISYLQSSQPFQSLFAQDKSKRFYEQDNGGLLSSDKKKLYFIGIIDIFTEFKYNNKKLLEHKLKHTFVSKDISCIPPDLYAERFKKFILN